MEEKKFLFIWDCDFTISDKHTLFFPATNLFGPEIAKKCQEYDNILYSKGHEYFLELLKENKISEETLLKEIDKIPLSPAIEKAFEIIKNNKSRCKVIILTSNLQLLSEEIMRNMGYSDIIDSFIGIRRVETKPYEYSRVYPNYDNRCQNCNPNPCKNYTFKEYIEHNNQDYSNYIKIFICDGGNDLCFAKNLTEKDYVFARKGFGFLKRIEKENKRGDIKAHLEVWENGNDLSQHFKKILD